MRTVKRFLLSVCTLILSSVSVAQAQTAPEVTRGLTWLQNQVQTDGTIAGELSSIARPIQVRIETALTLKQLGSSMPSMLVIKVQQHAEDTTETLSRKILVLPAGAGDSDSLVTKLLALQNLDGGFGADAGYQSNALDTAWALRALALTGRGNANAAMAARTFLVSRMGSNGGVTGSSSRQEIIDSAYTLSGLRTQGVDTTNIELLANFLKSTRAADSSWQANDYVTAEVWLALSASIGSASERAATQNFLKSLQRPDASWGGDPFTTALVLRALTVETALPVSTQASASGSVVDSNGATLAAATITLSGNSGTSTVTTNAQGGFSIAGLAAGLYQLNAARAGYQSAQVSFSLTTGQQLTLAPITLPIVTTSGVVRGVVSKAADNLPLSGVTMTLVGTPSRVTTTDATGVYEFTSVVPGNVSISATKAGFDTATGAGTLAAGQILTFSPALFVSGTTPVTPSRVSGKVVSAASGAALEGVSISIDGIEKLKTPANGQFDFELTSGSHRIAFAFAGYISLSQDFVLQNNAALSFGSVGLNPVRSSSRLSGRVMQPGGAPLAGALVEIKGGASTVTAADGTYAIDNVAQTTVNLSASLATYLPQSVNIAIPTPRDVTQDFTLQLAATASLAFSAATVAPNPASANTKVTISAPLINTGNVGAGAVIVLQIRDSADRVVDRGIPVDATGQPIGRLDLTAGQTRSVRAEWNTGRFAPGTYSLVLRAVTPQSINQSKPDGQLVAETRGTVVINSESVISGTITANPPVLRIGSSSPIKLTAVMRNEGNITLPPQNYRLTAIRAGETTSAYSQSVVLGAVAVGEVANLAFPDWTPANSGNYALQLVAEKASGTASSSVYVGDSASAAYTVTPNKTPIGTQTVLGKIAVTGQDAVSGSISDPLAPLIKTAITNAVAFNDTEATAWTLRNNCQGCHIQTQAVVGGEVNERLTAGDRLKRATLINNTSTNLTENGTYNEGYPGRGFPQTLTMLGMWAMANYNERDSHAAAFRRVASYLGSTQTAAGRWEYDHPTGWVATNYASTAFNLQSLAEVHRILKRVGPAGARNISATPFGARTTNASRGFVSQDAEGNLYLSTYAGEVIKRDAAGTTLYTWSGLNDPRRALRLADGRLIVATASGLFELKADGSTSLLANSPYLYDLVLGKNGKLYSDGFSTNTIYEIDTTSWTVIDWLSGVTDIGLSGPGRLFVEDDGSLLVPNYYGRDVVRIKPDKTFARMTILTNGQPDDVVRYQNKWWLATTTGLYRYNDKWEGERVLFPPDSAVWGGGQLADLLVLANGDLIAWPASATTLVKIGAVNIDASQFQLDLDSIAKTVDRATSYIAAQNNTTSADSFDLAHQLIGLEAARKFYAPTDAVRADTLYKGMESIGTALRSRQNANGGYGRYWYGQGSGSNSASDSLVTAQVGVALDALNPSARSPEVRKAIEWVLSTQDANGSWFSQNGIFSTREAATTWVAIWLPTMLDRLGGIDTDVTAVFGRNVSVSNARPVPATTEALSTGEVRYVWPMRGVTAAGREIVFDLSMADLQPGETRNASTEAYLTFKNSFTAEDQRAPIDIPAVSASAQVDLGITTDKPAYGANTAVSAPVVLTNNNPAAISGTLTVVVRDTAGGEVARLSQQSVTIPLQSPLAVPTNWNTGSTVVGRYVAEAELRNSATSQLLAYGKTPFDIITVGPVLGSAVSTDKAVYQSREQVIVIGRVYNQSANQYLNNYRVDEKVFAPDNSVIFAASRAIQQIAPGNYVEMRFPWRLNNASPDTYRVEQKVYDDAGVLKDTQMTTFKVQSSEVTGFGLSGTIAVSPKEVRVGASVNLTGSVTNSGNSVITNLPLTIRVVDPDKSTVIVEYPVTAASIAVSGSFTVPSNTWAANVRPNATYLAVLVATVGTGASATQQTLATDTIKVTPQIATTITATAGTPQSAKVSQPYTNSLEATVRDTAGNPFPGTTVIFSAPTTGASAAFSGAASGVTDAAGKVRVNIVANATAGSFTVTAATPGVASSAAFALTNTALTPPTITFVSPANNTSVNAPGSFALTASVTAPDSTVSKVEFFNGAALLGTGSLNGSNYVYNWTNVVLGEYPNVTAKVTDNKNQTATTSALRLIVAGCGTAAPFAFTPQQNVPLSTAITSNAITVTGITCPVDISVTGGEISINNAAFTAAASTVKLNDTVRVRVTSSSEYSKAVSALVTVGTIKGSFVVTTLSKADVDQTVLNEARILVLVSCPSSAGSAAGGTAVKDDDDDSTCAKTRKVFVDDYLTSLGVEFMTVTNVVDFKRELRCGKYNTYWVSGGFAKLKGTLDDELAEAVSRGESLIVDGVHDTRNKLIDEISGAKYAGVLSGNDHQVVLSGAVMPTGTFTSKGRAAKTTFTDATVHGLFDTATSGNTAIASDAYGLGKALTFAFDWVATAQQAASAVTAKEAMKRGISLIAPNAPTDLTPNEYVRFKTSIANPAATAGTFEIAATLPPAAVFASSVPAPTSITGNVAKWRITAPASGSADVVYSFRTPTQDSAQPVATTVSSVVDTTLTEIATKSTPLAVVGYATRSAAVKTQIEALNPIPAAEKQARDKAVTYLGDATTKRTANSLQDAIESLLKVQGELDKVASLNTQTVQVQVGLLIKTVEREFCLSGQTESYCTATASFSSNGAFTDIDSNDGNIKLIRVRGGGPGSPATGTLGGVWRVGSFIKQGVTEVKSVDNFTTYTSGKVYNWTFEYKGNGNTVFTLLDAGRPATIVTQNDRWVIKNALKFSVHVDAGIGSAFKIESNVLTLNGTALTDGTIVTNSNNAVSDISKVLAGPSLKQPFIVTGTLKLTFPPPAVVPGDKLYFQINGGEAPCADDEGK